MSGKSVVTINGLCCTTLKWPCKLDRAATNAIGHGNIKSMHTRKYYENSINVSVYLKRISDKTIRTP